MADFGYVAIDKAGKEIKGSVQADTKEKAIAELKFKGLIPLEITKQNALTKDINLSIGKPVKTRDLSIFCRQFVSMTRAGVTILESLSMLAEQTDNKVLQHTLTEVRVSVEKGETLADSMREHPRVFPSLLINMVQAGEQSGSLETSFERMAIQFEKDAKITGMVKNAMIYPIMVLVIAVAVVIVMLTAVIPNFADTFKQMDMDLPGITLVVIAMGDFMKARWYIVVLIIIAIAIGIVYFRKSSVGEVVFAKIGLKLPLFGVLTVKTAASRFARTLSTLLAAGIPLVEAVDITSKTMSNLFFKQALLEAKEALMRGVPLSTPIEECGLFPPMVYHMIRIGEEAGSTEEMLEKLADYYDEEVEIATKSLMEALQPLMIVVLALIVGVLIGAVMAPMLSMYQGLDNL